MAHQEPDWKQLEILVAKIQKQLSPDAEVKHNDRVVGKLTGTPRQVDVSVRSSIGQFSVFVAIDCKDYASPADVKDVEEFLGLIEDVGANKGALVCPKGFSASAKRRAEQAGIDLFSPIDTEPHKWQVKVSAPAVCDFRSLQYRLKLAFSGPFPFRITQDPTDWEVLDSKGVSHGKAVDLIRKKWNDGEISNEPHNEEDVGFTNWPVFMDNGHGQVVQVSLTASYYVSQHLFFGLMPIEKISGLRDEINGRIITNAVTTGAIDFEDVEEHWQQIDSIDKAPRRPAFILTATDVFVLE